VRQEQPSQYGPLSGRLQASPDKLLHEEVLDPQFKYELQHLLPWYILIEKVLLIEYERMGLIGRENVVRIGSLLSHITPDALTAQSHATMSDIAFAIEQYTVHSLDGQEHMWHVDRSRNDLQACAQLLFGREQLLSLIEYLFASAQAVLNLAERNIDIVMPGYTHYQAAQVISPGFYLAAIGEQMCVTLHRLLAVYDDINLCPLGAGAMAGQALPWDRHHMAELLGFNGPQRHALVAVASRDWILRIAGELSTFSSVLSRFATDFSMWSSSEYGFIDLPDHLAGISSAMPQKRNFPILERVRGRTAHIPAFYMDFVLGQRNTPYTNLVEVSKEAGSYLLTMFTTMRSVLRLFTTVVEHMQFRADRMRAACEREYVGGSTLADLLTLHHAIPHRMAQVIVGRYILLAVERQRPPSECDSLLLHAAGQQYGYEINVTDDILRGAFDVDYNFRSKQSFGSTNPEAVGTLLATQRGILADNRANWEQRRTELLQRYQRIETLVGSDTTTGSWAE
jgi:argininosuccinate lyase